jgi:alkylation response protein AidB-like acyl-CoA dehydrogenase
VGDLRTPVTPEGHALLDLISGHAERIKASAADNDRNCVFPTELFETFGQDGVLGATAPAELGGLGVSRLYDVAIALCALAEADASTALALHVQYSRGLTLSYEWKYGVPKARVLADRLLRSMAAGEAAVCGAVKDHHSATTTLTRNGSDGWLLSGRKTLVSMAPIATHFVVYATLRADGQPDTLVAPVVPADAAGLSIVDTWDGLGMRASGTVDVVLDECPVDTEDILVRSAINTRTDAVLAGQTVSSITMLGLYAGIAQAARDFTVGTFAKRPGDPPAAIRTLVAEIDARLYALRATAGAALANADLLSADRGGDPDERGRGMMVPFQSAKLMVNQMATAIVNDCVTLVGGAAYAAGHPLSRLSRDVRAGWFMQPYTYVDGVDFLSAQALNLDGGNDYMSPRAARSSGS